MEENAIHVDLSLEKELLQLIVGPEGEPQRVEELQAMIRGFVEKMPKRTLWEALTRIFFPLVRFNQTGERCP